MATLQIAQGELEVPEFDYPYNCYIAQGMNVITKAREKNLPVVVLTGAVERILDQVRNQGARVIEKPQGIEECVQATKETFGI